MCNDDHAQHAVGRRGLLVTGAAAALTLGSVSFANAAPSSGEQRRADQGRTRHAAARLPDFVYLPVEVPRGVREIHVAYTYERL